MRLLFLLFVILTVSAGFAAANPVLEYFLTMSYVEGGMEPCASVVERLGDSNKRTQFLRVFAPTLAAIQSVGKNSIDTEEITKTLERAVLYCSTCPSATFGIALMNAARNSDSTRWCRDRSGNRPHASFSNSSASATLPSNTIGKRSNTRAQQHNSSSNLNDKQSSRTQHSTDTSNDIKIID